MSHIAVSIYCDSDITLRGNASGYHTDFVALSTYLPLKYACERIIIQEFF